MNKCHYINLEKATQRNSRIIENFSLTNSAKWTLERHSAIGVDYVIANKKKGSITAPEKGCFLSHRNLINSLIHSNEHAFIVEDDACFGHKSQEMILNGISVLESDWDILYTDICIPNPSQMFDFFKVSEELRQKGLIGVYNLNNIPFAGTSAYILNKNSIQKIANILNSADELNTPIDIFFANHIHSRNINGFVLIPFATTIAKDSNSSQIQDSDIQNADLVWDAFRRLIWNERNLDDVKNEVKELEDIFQNESSIIFGDLIACLASKKIKVKS